MSEYIKKKNKYKNSNRKHLINYSTMGEACLIMRNLKNNTFNTKLFRIKRV